MKLSVFLVFLLLCVLLADTAKSKRNRRNKGVQQQRPQQQKQRPRHQQQQQAPRQQRQAQGQRGQRGQKVSDAQQWTLMTSVSFWRDNLESFTLNFQGQKLSNSNWENTTNIFGENIPKSTFNPLTSINTLNPHYIDWFREADHSGRENSKEATTGGGKTITEDDLGWDRQDSTFQIWRSCPIQSSTVTKLKGWDSEFWIMQQH